MAWGDTILYIGTILYIMYETLHPSLTSHTYKHRLRQYQHRLLSMYRVRDVLPGSRLCQGKEETESNLIFREHRVQCGDGLCCVRTAVHGVSETAID